MFPLNNLACKELSFTQLKITAYVVVSEMIYHMIPRLISSAVLCRQWSVYADYVDSCFLRLPTSCLNQLSHPHNCLYVPHYQPEHQI